MFKNRRSGPSLSCVITEAMRALAHCLFRLGMGWLHAANSEHQGTPASRSGDVQRTFRLVLLIISASPPRERTAVRLARVRYHLNHQVWNAIPCRGIRRRSRGRSRLRHHHRRLAHPLAAGHCDRGMLGVGLGQVVVHQVLKLASITPARRLVLRYQICAGLMGRFFKGSMGIIASAASVMWASTPEISPEKRPGSHLCRFVSRAAVTRPQAKTLVPSLSLRDGAKSTNTSLHGPRRLLTLWSISAVLHARCS